LQENAAWKRENTFLECFLQELEMTFLHRLFARLHHNEEAVAKYDENLRAEDGFVPASRIGSRGFLRIY